MTIDDPGVVRCPICWGRTDEWDLCGHDEPRCPRCCEADHDEEMGE